MKIRITERQYKSLIEQQQSVSYSCKSKYDTLLPKAQKYMKDWVSNPTTRQKFENNWGITAAKKGMSSKLRTDRVKTAYDSIVSAVSGLGTNKSKLLNTISTLSPNEFRLLLNSFSDKRTGYFNFQDMINQEFDRFDLEDARKLREILKNKGIQSSLRTVENSYGELLFHDFTMNADKSAGSSIEYDILGDTVDSIFKRYIEIIDNVVLRYYNKNDGALAFVQYHEEIIINLNCSYNDTEAYETLVHEIQHLLYFKKPLNPDIKVEKIFKTPAKPGTKKQTGTNDTLFKQISQNLGVSQQSLNYFYNLGKSKGEYSCDHSEKMSNIMAIRSLFNLSPNDKITFEMIKPYMMGNKWHGDINFLLSCWASKGFPDINNTLNRINQLAFQQTSSSGDRNLA
jgi:hypothetical protein